LALCKIDGANGTKPQCIAGVAVKEVVFVKVDTITFKLYVNVPLYQNLLAIEQFGIRNQIDYREPAVTIEHALQYLAASVFGTRIWLRWSLLGHRTGCRQDPTQEDQHGLAKALNHVA
jgi:hypothetical protein